MHEVTIDDLVILPELKDHSTAGTHPNDRLLADAILSQGEITDPIYYFQWHGRSVVLDGMRRVSLWRRGALKGVSTPEELYEIEFSDPGVKSAKAWISRRVLCDRAVKNAAFSHHTKYLLEWYRLRPSERDGLEPFEDVVRDSNCSRSRVPKGKQKRIRPFGDRDVEVARVIEQTKPRFDAKDGEGHTELLLMMLERASELASILSNKVEWPDCIECQEAIAGCQGLVRNLKERLL